MELQEIIEVVLNGLLQSKSVWIGGAVGLVCGFFVGIIGFVLFCRWFRQRDWSVLQPREEILRTACIVLTFVFMVPAICTCGAVIGAGSGAHHAIDKSGIVEKATVAAFSPIGPPLIDALGNESLSDHNALSMKALTEYVNEVDDQALSYARESLAQGVESLPDGVSGIATYLIDWLARTQTSKVMSKATSVLDKLHEGGKESVSTDDIFAAIGTVHFSPVAHKGVRRIVLVWCMATFVPALAISILPHLVVWGMKRTRKNSSAQKAELN